MTEIRVERKKSLPVWTYVVGALAAVAVVIGVLVSMRHDENDRASTRTVPAAQAATSGGTIQDTALLRGGGDPGAFVGRTVDLRNAEVGRVIGDRVFTVGSGDKEVFVRLDAPLDRGAAEQNVVVKPGQQLSLMGVVERAPATGAESWQGLSETDTAALKTQQLYVLARQIAGAR